MAKQTVTVDKAREIFENRANGRFDGMSAGKGGRAWIDGEFQLVELEALCVLVRHEAGAGAQGIAEFTEYWQNDDARELAEIVLRLNPAAGEIGAGMLANMQDYARRIVNPE